MTHAPARPQAHRVGRVARIASAAVAIALALVAGVAGASPTWSSPHIVASNLNAGGVSRTIAVSCSTAGSCAAGGTFTDGTKGDAFVVSQRGGHWSSALEVAAALNTGGSAAVLAISCAAAGACTAAGYYTSTHGTEAFAVTESDGHWAAPNELAAKLNTSNNAYVSSVSCSAPGDCTAGGSYARAGRMGAFVATETAGHWGPASPVGVTLNTGGTASVDAVSCWEPGDCAAGGSYAPGPAGSSESNPFLVSEANGHWGAAREVAAALNTGHDGVLQAISCHAAGECGASGQYTGATGVQGFVMTESAGRWGAAQRLRGSPSDPIALGASTVTISCTGNGACAAGGRQAFSGGIEAYVVTEVGGRWGVVHPVAQSYNAQGDDSVIALSCAAPGSCIAVGNYRIGRVFPTSQGFVVTERNGRWGAATWLPGTTPSSGDNSAVTVSCVATFFCAAGGEVAQVPPHSLTSIQHAFVSET